MQNAYESSSYFEAICFRKYLMARDKAILQYCFDHGLTKVDGVVCREILGVYNSNDTDNALEYCGIVSFPFKAEQK